MKEVAQWHKVQQRNHCNENHVYLLTQSRLKLPFIKDHMAVKLALLCPSCPLILWLSDCLLSSAGLVWIFCKSLAKTHLNFNKTNVKTCQVVPTPILNIKLELIWERDDELKLERDCWDWSCQTCFDKTAAGVQLVVWNKESNQSDCSQVERAAGNQLSTQQLPPLAQVAKKGLQPKHRLEVKTKQWQHCPHRIQTITVLAGP